MQNSMTILRKEFRQYFDSPIGYIFITVFLVTSSWLFFRTFFLVEEVTVRPMFLFVPWLFLFFVPAVTMRLWAEEKKAGTMEVLMTLPVRDWEVVAGKFGASLLFLVLSLALTFSIPLTSFFLAEKKDLIDWGPILTSYLGAILLGAAFLAIGIWVSSLTENQIVAFILGIAASFVLMILGERIVTAFLPAVFAPWIEYLGLNRHFNSIARGVIDSRDIIYYLSVIGLFLYLTVRSVESRKWR